MFSLWWVILWQSLLHSFCPPMRAPLESISTLSLLSFLYLLALHLSTLSLVSPMIVYSTPPFFTFSEEFYCFVVHYNSYISLIWSIFLVSIKSFQAVSHVNSKLKDFCALTLRESFKSFIFLYCFYFQIMSNVLVSDFIPPCLFLNTPYKLHLYCLYVHIHTYSPLF